MLTFLCFINRNFTIYIVNIFLRFLYIFIKGWFTKHFILVDKIKITNVM